MLDTSKMESFNAHCPDNQAANTLPLSTHCGLPDGMLVHAPLCTRLTKALAFAPESLRCQGSRQFGPSDRHVHGERIGHAQQHDGAQDSTISPSVSGTGSLRETTRLQAHMTSPSLRSKAYAARDKTCARRTTAHLHSCCARHTS